MAACRRTMRESKSPIKLRTADAGAWKKTSHGIYSSIKSVNIVPEEFIPVVPTIEKFVIKGLLKFIGLGVRPTKLPLTSVLRYIEEIYTKMSKLKPKQLFKVINDEHTLAKFVYDHFIDDSLNPGK